MEWLLSDNGGLTLFVGLYGALLIYSTLRAPVRRSLGRWEIWLWWAMWASQTFVLLMRWRRGDWP